jgi:hypothetical protein
MNIRTRLAMIVILLLLLLLPPLIESFPVLFGLLNRLPLGLLLLFGVMLGLLFGLLFRASIMVNS